MSVRLRLTLVYAALFLATGVVLLGVAYTLVERSLPDPDGLIVATERPDDGDGVELLGPGERLEEERATRPLSEAQQRELAERTQDFEREVRDRALDALLVQAGAAIAVMTLVALGSGWYVAGRVLRPLHEITDTARRLSSTDLHQRIALEGPHDELRELADTFDAMLDRLDASFEGQRRFVGNASHELRTPLAVIGAEVDVALADPDATADDLRAMARRVRAATRRSDHLVEGLLALAESEHGAGPGDDEVDLATLAEDVLDDVAATATRAQVRLDPHLGPAPTAGDRRLLERLVVNVVENAVHHNLTGGWVAVSTGADDRWAELRVRNSGPVVPADVVDELFTPFRRGLERGEGPERRGVGLGLSIVRAVADRHGGQVRATARPQGGLDVTVRVPRRTAERVQPAGHGATASGGRSSRSPVGTAP